jgi:hypothetical protein
MRRQRIGQMDHDAFRCQPVSRQFAAIDSKQTRLAGSLRPMEMQDCFARTGMKRASLALSAVPARRQHPQTGEGVADRPAGSVAGEIAANGLHQVDDLVRKRRDVCRIAPEN